MAIAPPPPGRPLLEIVSCESNYNHVAIIYPCACSNNVHIRVRIESTIDSNAGCRFTREDGGSEVLQVIFKIPSAL